MKTKEAPLPGPTGLEDTLSPVDLPEPPRPLPRPLRWTSEAIAAATLFLALFNAHAIRGWTYDLPPSAASERVIAAAEGWYAASAALGLDRPVEAMRGWWQSAKEMRFAGSAVEDVVADPADAGAAERPR
ncbi:MAG TPA: hypothetical protein VGW40_16725 [Allosphingosinicella sp.]|nr:hypothetical protein [Allosphingosinicella sp.]